MRRLVILIVSLCTALTALALVPPRDPARWAEWQVQVSAQQVEGLHRAPMVVQTMGHPAVIPKVLVIMANFADYQLISTKAEVDSMFNGHNWTKDGAKGSVRQYFYDQSSGAYNPQFDIVGPITLSKGYASYGTGANAGAMVNEACQIVNDSVDFSQYDLNGDNKIDLVYVFYAGFGENDHPSTDLIPSSTKLVWPQCTEYSSGGTFDGKRLFTCVYTNELDGVGSSAGNLKIAGIGAACHEFGHALGLPDLYSTSGSTPTRSGMWDVMDYGMYNDDMHSPPAYSAHERFLMGWLTPTLIVDPDTLSLTHIASSNEAYMITATDASNMNATNPNPADFYLLENRQRMGWDRALPGSGMMITHIRYNSNKWVSNAVNTDASNLGVEIILAQGTRGSSWAGTANDLFPAGATEYTAIADHAIEQITMSNGVVSFVYRGGVDTTHTDTVATALPIERITAQVYKTIRGGQVLIHTPNGTYNLLGVKQEY